MRIPFSVTHNGFETEQTSLNIFNTRTGFGFYQKKDLFMDSVGAVLFLINLIETRDLFHP